MKLTFCSGSCGLEAMSKGRSPASSDRSAARAERLPERTGANVAGRPSYMRSLYDEIVTRLRASGPVHEDAVAVGVFLKAERKIAEVRPLARSLRVWLLLPREVPGRRAVRASSELWAVDLRFTG